MITYNLDDIDEWKGSGYGFVVSHVLDIEFIGYIAKIGKIITFLISICMHAIQNNNDDYFESDPLDAPIWSLLHSSHNILPPSSESYFVFLSLF